MENGLILNSIGIGGAIFAGLILLWFISIYIQKRMASDRSSQGFITTKKKWDEKRLNARVAISWQAILESFGRADDVQIKDISLGGAFVACPKPLSLKHRFRIIIDVPNLGPLRLKAEEVWSNFSMPEDRVVNRGMGIHFIENSEKHRQQLSDALKESIEYKATPLSTSARFL
jgi:hypothetical protein